MDNSLFRLAYRFDIGSWNNKLLPLAAQYIQYLGTNKYSAEQISRQFYDLACNFNINTGSEQSALVVSGLQENFDKAVGLFEHLLQNCKPDETALALLKNNIQKARANNKLNKGAISSALQSYAIYGAQNPFNYVLTNEELQALKAQDLIDLLHSITSHQHKITYFGPLTLEAFTEALKPVHTLPANWTVSNNAINFERTKQTNNQVLFADYDAVQAEIFWVKNLDEYSAEAEPVVHLFNNYFGAGMSSVVFKTIRESKALAYSTFANVIIPSKKKDKFALIAYVGSQADKMNEAVKGMNELLNEMPKSGQGFENAKESLKKDIETDRVSEDGIISNYLNLQRKGVEHDIRKDNYVRYKNLQWNDIFNYHKEKLAGQPYTYCVVASEKRINMDDLKKYGEVRVLSLEELFGY